MRGGGTRGGGGSRRESYRTNILTGPLDFRGWILLCGDLHTVARILKHDAGQMPWTVEDVSREHSEYNDHDYILAA